MVETRVGCRSQGLLEGGGLVIGKTRGSGISTSAVECTGRVDGTSSARSSITARGLVVEFAVAVVGNSSGGRDESQKAELQTGQT